MTDEFEKVVAKVTGGNRPDLIAQHMDRAEDNEEGKIYAETWNSYAKLYNGNTIKKFITLDNATKSLERYGVGTEEFSEEADTDTNDNKEPSFFQRNNKKNIKNWCNFCRSLRCCIIIT